MFQMKGSGETSSSNLDDDFVHEQYSIPWLILKAEINWSYACTAFNLLSGQMSWVRAVQIGLPPDSHHISDQNILAGWDAELCQLCCLLARSWCNLGWWCHTLDLFQLLKQLTPAAVCWFQRLVFWVINDEVTVSIFIFFVCYVSFCLHQDYFLLSILLCKVAQLFWILENQFSVWHFVEKASLLRRVTSLLTDYFVCCMQNLWPCFIHRERTSDFDFLAIWHIS